MNSSLPRNMDSIMKPRATSVQFTNSSKTFSETFAMPFELHAAD